MSSCTMSLTHACLHLTGIDSEGHAANFVETEQIVLYNGAQASFVQASNRIYKTYLHTFVLLIFWGSSGEQDTGC